MSAGRTRPSWDDLDIPSLQRIAGALTDELKDVLAVIDRKRAERAAAPRTAAQRRRQFKVIAGGRS